MESSKLKNIVLVILVITNVFLGALMISQRVENRHTRQQTMDNALTLLERNGISVERAVLPDADFPPVCTLERDTARELEVFTALLGDGVTLTQRGLVYLYEGPLGRAEVRGDGAFSVRLTPGAYPLGSSAPQVHVLTVLTRMGFDGQITADDGAVLTAVQCWDGCPVFSCTAEAFYEDGALVSIEGTRLVGEPVLDAGGQSPLSLPTLLVRFRGSILDSGDACNAILEATQGYALTSGGAGFRLTPVLRLDTDTNRYFLSALTGEFSRV